MTLEAAIFDRPTLVPTFHPYQPEQARDYYSRFVMSKHFKRLESLDLVPIIRQIEGFAPAINRALKEPSWYEPQRAQLVHDYVHFTDGHSVERLSKLMIQLAT